MTEKLTPQEEQALQAVFKVGEGNIKLIVEHMKTQLPYTTVASTVKNLERKGYVSARLIGNTYLYKPAISQQEYKKQFMTDVVRNHFDNSYKALINFFVEQKKLSPKELKDIVAMIEGKKK
ncbi:BlaI/MecI/CopY family transcriptional regulator [Agriterribacter sp.]|uniref:BlaI/MecI/CopY family transcriptional regulator n=1 Tax=Agriterribacter sp. TaxID=2821509 RepID=UPI002BB1D763|nr:BlaI/MecI/CopY family transcriptional regulator [Agriterribacter sp.]HRP54644.1 BlaI/MecI/CopY family transcriptional regulator [Agriterribacter sp.]